jgi:hypothetical protein
MFPTISAANLRGQMFSLPTDFGGKYNIVLMPFSIEQQAFVDTWMTEIGYIERQYPEVQYYELPVVQWVDVFGQRVIDGWMRVGIPDLRVQQKTITLYVDIPTWRKTLRLPTGENYTFLVDRKGVIYWQEAGAYTFQKGLALRQRLKTLLSQAS